jgi:hypothetical protein
LHVSCPKNVVEVLCRNAVASEDHFSCRFLHGTDHALSPTAQLLLLLQLDPECQDKVENVRTDLLVIFEPNRPELLSYWLQNGGIVLLDDIGHLPVFEEEGFEYKLGLEDNPWDEFMI